MDELAQNLLATLKKSSAPIDTKLNLFNTLKSNIKHQRIPESAQATTLECIRLAIASQTSSSLVATGFSALGHLIKRLTLQDQVSVVFSQRSQIIPVLLERLGDAKEQYRSAALQALCDLWPARQADVEKAIKEGALLSSNVRAREGGIQWVTKMHQEHQLQFRAFVPSLVECLDHADGTLRDCAKNNLVELFRDANDRAKADLKRQLIAQNVRKSIASYILSHLNVAVPLELTVSAATTHVPPRSDTPHREISLPDPSVPAEPVLPPSAETTHIDPLYVDSHRDLEDMLRAMNPCFEGRESESNWMARDLSVLKLRRLIKGNAPTEFHAVLLAGIKTLFDGILKVVNTLRTTMSTNGCEFVQELAKTLGHALDPMVEILMQNLVKMCSATKNISSQNGNKTIDVILNNVTYTSRLMQHAFFATQDKNVQPRMYAAGWIKTIVKKQVHNKSHFEHSGGLELAEKCIKKGLTDANPKVRESMRSTYWLVAQAWPDKGEAIMGTLDAKSKQLLEKDPSNPNATQTSLTSSVGPSAASNPRAVASRSNLRETIAAQKKASLAAKKVPDRPNSAMATLTPAKPASAAPVKAASSTTQSSTTRTETSTTSQPAARPTSVNNASSSQNSLMSGPIRRPKRPEVPRPATADPYANRRPLRAETPPSRSPGNSPARPASKSSTSSIASHAAKSGLSGVPRPGTANSGRSSKTTSPHVSPAKARPKTIHGPETLSGWQQAGRANGTFSSPPKDESHGLLAQDGKPFSRGALPSRRARQENDRPGSGHSNLPSMVEEDEFTLVMPQKSTSVTPRMSKIASPQRLKQTTPRSGEKAGGWSEKQAREAAIKMQQVVATDDGGEVMVYEDPHTAQAPPPPEEGEVAVLEELPVNEHQDGRPVSPSKKEASLQGEGQEERADVLKNRRLLNSGIDRLRAKTLDPHGFRRLQELVRGVSREGDGQLGALLQALDDYIEAPNEALKVGVSKGLSLKSQALTTMRAVVTLSGGDDEVQSGLPRTLCALLSSVMTMDGVSHVVVELEKTAEEVVRQAGGQAEQCIDAVVGLAGSRSLTKAPEHQRIIRMALGTLSKLLATVRGQGGELSGHQKQRLGGLAVQFLDDTDSDIRRADTEFCLELFDAFGEEGKEQFWASLKGAREAQLNLVAYYLARRKRERQGSSSS